MTRTFTAHDPRTGDPVEHGGEATELHAAPRQQPPAEAVGNRPRLLVDLLEHEVRIAPLLDRVEREGELVHLLRERHVVDRADVARARADHGQLAVVEVDDLVGVFHDRRGVGGHE